MAALRWRSRTHLVPTALLTLLLALLLGSAAPAGAADLAQPPPTTATTSATSPSPSPALPTTTTLPERDGPVPRLVPGGQYGDFPLDNYDFMYSTNEDGKDDILGLNIPGVNLDLPVPASQDQGRRTVQGMIASWAFAGTVTIVKLALLIVGWAFNFPLLSLLGSLVHDAVHHLDGAIIGPSGIRAGVAVLAAFIAGWYLLTARLVHGLREALIGVVMIALAGMMVSNVDRYYHAASEFGAGISSVIVGIAGDSQESGVDAVQRGMAQALVAEPWALLNYGNPLEGACAEAGREVLAGGPHGTSSTPRSIMRSAGCQDEAAFNQDPTTERAIDAGLLFLGVLPAALFMILVAFSLLIAQFRLAIAFVVAPGALLLGAIASTRHLAGRWALFAVKALLGIIAPVVVLSAMALIDLLILTGIDFNVTVGGVRIDLVAKLVLINAANFALWMKRKVVADGIYRATTVKADRALVRAGIPTAGPETPKPLAARLDKEHVMPGVRDPVAAVTNRTKAAVGGARAGTAKLATGAATVAAGPAARGSMAAAAVLGVAQKTAVATGGTTTDSEGRRTGTASGGGSRRAVPARPATAGGVGGAATTGSGIPVGTAAPAAAVPSVAFATAAARSATPNGHGRLDGSGNGHGTGLGGTILGGTAIDRAGNGSVLGRGANGSAAGHGAPGGPAAGGSFGIPGPAGPLSAPPGGFATTAAGPGARPGVGYVADRPVSGGPFSGLDSHGPADGHNGNGNGNGNGHANGNGGLLDLTSSDHAPSPGGHGANGNGNANGNGANGTGVNGNGHGFAIPSPPPPPPPPAEPVAARRVATAGHEAPLPTLDHIIGPVPPPPPPGPRAGEDG